MPQVNSGTPVLSQPAAIDAYTHWAAPELRHYMNQQSGKAGPYDAFYEHNSLFDDVSKRLKFMDEYGIESSIMAPSPWVESTPVVAQNAAKFAEAARVCNDAQTRAAKAAPERLLNLACLPSSSGEAMVEELDRAIHQLGMVGCELPVGPTMKRMDHPDMEALYAEAEKLGVGIWLHPSRPITYSDYQDETASKYLDWQSLGWLHDTSSAMVRIVMSGVFDRYPKVKIIVHHSGAMVAQFAGRMEACWADFENSGVPLGTSISKPYIDHFRKFYTDSAIFNHDPDLLHHAWKFFGPDKMLFGSDTPYEPQRGAFVNASRSSVEAMPITDEQKAMVYRGNIKSLLKMI